MKLYRPGPLIVLFSLAFLGLLSLGYYILTADTPAPAMLEQPVAVKEPTPVTAPAPKEYEEETSELEDFVKEADLAIIEAMKDQGILMNQLTLVNVELRKQDHHSYHYQVLQLPNVNERQLFLVALHKHLYERLPKNAELLDNGDNEAIVKIDGTSTHSILLEAKPRVIALPKVKGPKMAIVIDDIGENLSLLKGLLKVDLPLTFAVWPNASTTRTSAELVSQSRHDLIVHFPMEPQGYPKVDPGDDALFVSMTADEIRQRIKDNLARIPEAIGVNNHMGSRFTSSMPGMTVALEEFKRNGLFFLDSLTSSKSVGSKAAHAEAINFYERDTFLDNVKDVNAIIHQLKKSEKVALSKGVAIAIGHPYKETLAALKAWNKTRNQSIKILPLSHLSPQ